MKRTQLFLSVVIALAVTVISQSLSAQQNSVPLLANSLLACGSPMGVAATNIAPSSATITWPAVSTATSYKVQYKKSSSGNWSTTTTTTASKNLSNLSSATAYDVRVQTTCSSGTSSYSSIINFTTLGPCVSPTVITSNSVSPTSQNISWTSYTGILYYNFRYRVTGTPSWTNDSSLTNSKVINGLTPSTTYDYQVQTRCTAGLLSTFSSTNTFTTAASAACGTVTGSTTSAITTTGATISWGAVAGAISYNLQYRESGAGAWTLVNTTSTSKALSTLVPNTSYEYQVQTVCSSANSAYTATSSFTTLAVSCGLPNVNLFGSTNITSSSANVSWAAVAGATGYNVKYRTNGVGAWSTVSSTSTSAALTGLNASTLYEFQVQTLCPGGIGSFSASGIFTTSAPACTVPAGLNVTGITVSGATLNWTAVTLAASYNVRYRISGAAAWTTTTSTSASKALTGLTAGTLYEYQVQTVCSANTSAYSASSTFTTTAPPCSVAGGLTSSAITNTGATLSWTAVAGALSYNIQYRIVGAASWTSTTSTTSSKAITGLTAGSSYEFQVQTVCTSATAAFSTSATFNTPAVSCSVPDLNFFGSINISSAGATVYWTAISNAISYDVQYRVYNTAAWSTVNVTTATAILTGLTASSLYEFQVRTNCSGGSSAYSASGVFTTLAAGCGVPVSTTFTTTGISSTGATCNWTAVAGATGYRIQFRVNGSSSAWSYLSVATNSGALTGLSSSTTYEYQVQSMCSVGSSAFSASALFTTSASSCGIPNVNLFTSTNKTASSCTVGWSAVAGTISYNVQYRVKLTAGAWSTVSTTTASANLTGLLASTQYEFQVQTVCASGTSVYSASGVFTTTAMTGCGTATALSASNITSITATLNWAVVSGASSYNINYRKTGTASWLTGTSTTNSFSLTGLTAATPYEFQIQTVCSAVLGSFTASATFTTASTGAATLPVPDHIVVVIFENHAYSQIIGNAAAPRINAFANEANTMLFSQSYAIEHPSQPNYLDLFSGGNQGVTNNVLPAAHFTTMNLARALINAGRTFNYYSEDLPSVGWDGETNLGYARKHNALANWMGTGTNQVSSSLNLPFTSFPTDYTTLPTVSFVSPNLVNSMHDGTGNAAITAGDNWFYSKIYPYAVWARTHNSLLIFTFDEDDNVSSNRIATIFSGQMVAAGVSATGINHYNVLRTIEDMYGTAHSGNAATATPIHGVWTNGYRMSRPESAATDLNLTLYPNPASDNLNIHYTLSQNSNVTIRLMSMIGAVVADEKYLSQESGDYDLNMPLQSLNLNKGIYFVEVLVNDTRTLKKIVIE
jgi:hypothetical protein